MWIDEYRVKCFENHINQNLQVADALMVALKRDGENFEKEKEKFRRALPALKMSYVQKQNLNRGRQIGTSINKQRARAVKNLACRINNDLLTHPDTARWNISQRARYIEENLATATIEIVGSRYKATMVNGKKYANSTIRAWIVGT